MRRPNAKSLRRAAVELAQKIRVALLAQGRHGRANVVIENPRRHRGDAASPIRGDLFGCMSACQLAGLESRGDLRQ